jgi:hypothetical protein
VSQPRCLFSRIEFLNPGVLRINYVDVPGVISYQVLVFDKLSRPSPVSSPGSDEIPIGVKFLDPVVTHIGKPPGAGYWVTVGVFACRTSVYFYDGNIRLPLGFSKVA